MMSASVHGDAGASSAGFSTMQFPKASAGAIFHAGIANGKFHGVMAPMTPIGSRVTSTSTPGRTESSFSPAKRSVSPAKNLNMYPARALADAVGEWLALLAREQSPQLFLARQHLRAGAIEDVEPLLRGGARPGL